MAFQKVASLPEIAQGSVKGVNFKGERIAIFNLGGEIFATTDVCTHEGCLISDNHIIEDDGKTVECTCHGSHFNIKTGEVTGPPAAESLKTYKVKVEGEEVFVEV